MERLSCTSYYLAKTAFESTPCGQTIKRVFGGAVCSVAHQSLTQLGLGWKMGSSAEDESSLTIDWMDGKPAPEAVLELLACKCPRSCRLSDCVCMANVLTCTQTCVDCRIVKTKPHRRMWKSLFMEIAKRRMKVVTEKSAYIPDTPLLCSSATVQV